MAQLADGFAQPWPIGIFEDRALQIFLASARGQLVGQLGQRSNLLLCGGMHLGSGDRRRTVSTLQKNGFACEPAGRFEADSAPAAFENALQRKYSSKVVGDAAGGRPSDYLWRFYSALVGSKFVMAPYGRRRDSYRFWEALACGAVPVMLRDGWYQLDKSKYEGLPVVWVDDWKTVTPAFLRRRWQLIYGAPDMRPSFR